MLGGDLLACGVLVYSGGFIRLVAGRKEDQGDEHCGENENEPEVKEEGDKAGRKSPEAGRGVSS